MKKESRDIQDAIRKLAGLDAFNGSHPIVGVVTTVDEINRQCALDSVLDGETVTYSTVNLSIERNDGFIQIPAVGSTVLCLLLPDGEAYVVGFSDVTKVICYIDGSNSYEFSSSGFVFNGGTLDGMVKVNSLVTKLNNQEQKLDALINVLTGWTVVANDGGAALKATVAALVPTTLAPTTPTVKADLENTKIKQ